MRAFRPRLVVNQVRAKSDLELGAALASAARRRLGLPIDYIGHLEHDDAVWLAVRKRRPLFIEQPESRAAKCIERITRRLLAIENEKPAPFEARAISELTNYEILEIDPGATDEEIRRAVRRVREVYGHDSLVVPGLYNRDRLSALHMRIDEAYETLIDEERRRAYDTALFPEGPPRRLRSASSQPVGPAPTDRSGPIFLHEELGSASHPVVPAAPRPPEPEISPATEFTGALLRQLREARGIDLHAISQRTKITVAYLRAIEGETIKAMPAMVYVRGFLVEYARFLRLDVKRVLDTLYQKIVARRRASGDDEDERP
jgi:flagellar biosynthesis protein FlhG